MAKKESKKFILVKYGLLMGLLLVVLQAVNYRTVIRDIKIEVYGILIATLFLGLGIWMGQKLFQSKSTIKNEKPAKLRNPLSDRELDVLKLMSEGLSNQQIADQLYVSLNTIKTHTSNIYIKLDVKRRTQAIQKGRELRLF